MRNGLKKAVCMMLASCMVFGNGFVGTELGTGTVVAEAAVKPTLNAKTKVMRVGQRTSIAISNTGKKKVKWSVDKKYQKYIAIAGSGRKCYVRAKRVGTAYVKVTVGKATYKCKVVVKKGAGLSDTAKYVNSGKSFELGLYGTSKTARWKSSNNKVVKLTKVGKNKYKVAGVKAGTAYVSATIGKKAYKCKVVVKGKTVAPKLSATKLTVNYNQIRTLKLTGVKSNITWKVANPRVLKLTRVSNGSVKLQGLKVGTTKVKATYGKTTKTCNVTVKAVSSPYLNTSNPKLTVGSRKPIASYITGSKVGITSWVSKNPSVVDVDDFGNLVAKGIGSTTVIITVDGVDLYLGVVVVKSDSNTGKVDDKNETVESGNKETEKNTEKSTEKSTEKHTEKNTEKSTEKVTEKPTEKTTEKATEKTTEKTTEKSTEKVTEKETEKETEKVTEKETEKETEAGFVYEGKWFDDCKISGSQIYSSLKMKNALDKSEFEVYSEKGLITVSEPSYETAPNGVKRWVFSFTGRKKGVDKFVLKVHNKIVKTCTVTVTSDDTEFLKFDSWLDTKQSEFLSNGTWTDSMSKIEKLAALGQWTLDNFDYVAYNPHGVYCFMYGEGGNCTCTAALICNMANKLGLKSIIDVAKNSETHEYAKVYDENGKAWGIDAGYSGKAGHRGTVSVFEYKQ